MIRTLVLLVLVGACLAGPRLRAADEPLKLGSVWLRSFDEAAKAAQKEGKPILLLFQEAPACVACEGAGSDTFLDAKILEAAADFVTATVYTDREGKDAADAKRFHEARQKTPVIRFLDAAGKDLVERREGIEPAATLERMKLALAKSKEAGKEAGKAEERPKP